MTAPTIPGSTSKNPLISGRRPDKAVYSFHAAVAAGLHCEFDVARRIFNQIQSCAIDDDRQTKLHSEVAALAALLDDPAQFRLAVRRTIDTRRAQACLPPLADCLDSLNPHAVTVSP